MCELFSLSSRHPATVKLSLEELSRRGGLIGPHKDGWGVAYYLEGDVRLLKDTGPASSSNCLRFIQDHPFASTLVISHIRKATQGGNALRNCQPFTRELGAAMHVFAHNGHFDLEEMRRRMPLGTHRPVGETDSEYAFCALLARLASTWLRGPAIPSLAERLGIIEQFARDLRPLGPANFLYSDGDALFAHGHKRTHADGLHPPGLHVLSRHCTGESHRMDTSGLAISTESGPQSVVLFASVPLTSEAGWRALADGEVVAARNGQITDSHQVSTSSIFSNDHDMEVL